MAEDVDTHTTISDFCEQLAAELVARRRRDLPLDDGDMAAAMYDIAKELRSAARQAFHSGKTDLGDDLLEILDEIGPNPSTGSFDYFWSNLRQLQPARAGVDNPLYPDLKLKQAAARVSSDQTHEISSIWRDLIHKSADHIVQRL